MTQKELGYVELEWTCPKCNGRNPGTAKTCTACGAPQPENVKFEEPLGSTLVTDAAVVQAAEKGADVHCPFCNARNPADAEKCSNCGAPLQGAKQREAGEVVGAFSSTPGADVTCAVCGAANPAKARSCARCGAPLRAAGPTVATRSQAAGGSGIGVLIAAGVFFVVVVALFMFFASRTTQVTGSAREARWVRTITVEALAPVSRSGWYDELPVGVTPDSCEQAMRSVSQVPQAGAKEVCGTPYTLDTGTGYGKVVQDCEYQIYDNWCSYSVLQWMPVNTLSSSGVGFSPQWPVGGLSQNQRLGQRNEQLFCAVIANDKLYQFPMASYTEFEQCQPGTQWQLSINTFGSVTSAKPQ